MGSANQNRPVSRSISHNKSLQKKQAQNQQSHMKRQLFNNTCQSIAPMSMTTSHFKNNKNNFKLVSLGLGQQQFSASESERSHQDMNLSIPRFGETKSSVYSNVKLSSQHPKNHNFTFSIFQNPYQTEANQQIPSHRKHESQPDISKMYQL